MPPNQPAVVGKAAIRELVSQLLEIETFTVAHHPRTVEVSLGGDLACLYYTYEFTVKDAKGTAVTEKGKDISVYKQISGSWKLVIDMWNSDAPAANEPEPGR
jgi:ketosteroid isomerase-like protein